jgi:hypothetical protein
MARKHLAEGVARRFIMIGDSVEAIDRIAAANRTRVLNPGEAAELNLHTNSYYVHLRGTLDNLAWALHYEYGILGTADENDLRMRRQCGLADVRFRTPLRSRYTDLDRALSSHDTWLADLRDFRDPVVHRIPLYAVPGVIERGSEDEQRIRHDPSGNKLDDRYRRGSKCCDGTHGRVVRDWKLQTCVGAIWTRRNSDSGPASAGLGRLRAPL